MHHPMTDENTCGISIREEPNSISKGPLGFALGSDLQTAHGSGNNVGFRGKASRIQSQAELM